MPVPSEMHVDRYLTDLSVAFRQDQKNFVSDKVFPIVSVKKQTDQFVIFDRGSFWRDQLKERPLGGRADVADWAFSSGTYRAVERALAHKVDDRVRANTDDPLDPDRAAQELLTSAVAINNDRRWAAEYFATGIWTTDKAGTTDFVKFSAATPADPVAVIDEFKEEVLKLTAIEPNTLVVGPVVHRTIKNMAVVLDRIKYTQRGVVTDELLGEMFGVKYIVARSVYNTAKEGQTSSFDWTLGTGGDEAMLLVYAAPNPGLNTPSGGYTFAWTDLLDGAANLDGAAIMRGRDDFAHSDHFEIRSASDIQLVAADLGVFIDDCL